MSRQLIDDMINNFSGKELAQTLQVLAAFSTHGYEIRTDIFEIVGEAIDLQAHSRNINKKTGKKNAYLPVVGTCAECGGPVVRYSCRRTECYDCGLVVRRPAK